MAKILARRSVILSVDVDSALGLVRDAITQRRNGHLVGPVLGCKDAPEYQWQTHGNVSEERHENVSSGPIQMRHTASSAATDVLGAVFLLTFPCGFTT